jgi:hypothetical protein
MFYSSIVVGALFQIGEYAERGLNLVESPIDPGHQVVGDSEVNWLMGRVEEGHGPLVSKSDLAGGSGSFDSESLIMVGCLLDGFEQSLQFDLKGPNSL